MKNLEKHFWTQARSFRGGGKKHENPDSSWRISADKQNKPELSDFPE